MIFSNHSQKRWGVVTPDREKAESLIIAIEWSVNKDILRRVQSKDHLFTEFTDGTLLRWINPAMNKRGIKLDKIWCDRNIDKDIFEQVIMPIYRGKIEDISWI